MVQKKNLTNNPSLKRLNPGKILWAADVIEDTYILFSGKNVNEIPVRLIAEELSIVSF